MKTYYNETTNEWYYENTVLRHLENGKIVEIVPTIKQLTEWGFKLYTPEPIDPQPEIDPKEIERQAKEVEEEYKNRIQKQTDKARMDAILKELSDTDYLVNKYIEGEDMTKYGDWIGTRKRLRKEYNALEDKYK